MSAPDISARDLALARAHAQLGMGIGGIAALLAATSALGGAPQAGAALMLVAVIIASFYASMHLLLTRAVAPLVLRGAASLFESVVPALSFWILARGEGPTFAAESWVVPLLCGLFITASVLRLEPRIPAAMGVASALLYGLVWQAETQAPLSLLLVQMSTLVSTGIAGASGASRLRTLYETQQTAHSERERFGRYTLGREIASGGMGRVIEAAYCPEGGFEQRVAIKILHPHLVNQPGYIDRFRTEAEITARLLHPNIVAALDFGKLGESWFLVMEYIDGRTLQAVLSERRDGARPLPGRIVAWIGAEIAHGLEHAHQIAHDENRRPLVVLHRDLSPSNIMLDRAGRVRITDFGVSRMLGDKALETSTLVGTPSYVAPEVLHNHRADPRADLWALGVILWEALAGERLFMRDTVAATMLAVIEDPIAPVSSRRPELAAGWDRLFERLLARNPDERIATASELLGELSQIAAVEGPVLADDVRELLVTEELLEELELDLEPDAAIDQADDATAPEPAPPEAISSEATSSGATSSEATSSETVASGATAPEATAPETVASGAAPVEPAPPEPPPQEPEAKTPTEPPSADGCV